MKSEGLSMKNEELKESGAPITNFELLTLHSTDSIRRTRSTSRCRHRCGAAEGVGGRAKRPAESLDLREESAWLGGKRHSTG